MEKMFTMFAVYYLSQYSMSISVIRRLIERSHARAHVSVDDVVVLISASCINKVKTSTELIQLAVQSTSYTVFTRQCLLCQSTRCKASR